MEAHHLSDRAIDVPRERGTACGADADPAGVPRVDIRQFHCGRALQRIGPGPYNSDAP